MAALPKETAEKLQYRLLKILNGGDPRRILELPGSDGGRPPKSVRNIFIALDYYILRNRENEKYGVALHTLHEKWNLSESAIKSAVSEFSDDELLPLIAQLPKHLSVTPNLMSISKKFSQLPPLV